MNAMRLRAKYVSASENGYYYQVAFENTDPADDAADVDGPDSPYFRGGQTSGRKLSPREHVDPDDAIILG